MCLLRKSLVNFYCHLIIIVKNYMFHRLMKKILFVLHKSRKVMENLGVCVILA